MAEHDSQHKPAESSIALRACSVLRAMCRRAWLAASVAVFIMLSVWIGCAVTEKNYKTLSFFFDGVPPPLPEGAIGTRPGSAHAIEYVHAPFAAENCRACHQTAEQGVMSRNQSGMCLQCHREVPDRHRYMHGAVTAMACLWCHDPHASPHKHLLREQGPDLCLNCHTRDMISQSIAGHRDLTRNCLDCHMGHGGEHRFYLTPAAQAAANELHDASGH